MSCQMAFIASGITACWPVPPASPTSRRSGPYSGRQSQRPHLRPRPRLSRSPCANRAPAVAAPCGSSRYSDADKSRSHGPHRRSRPHDEMPINLVHLPPVPVSVADSRRLSDAAKSTDNSCAPPHLAHECTGQARKKLPIQAAIPPDAIIGADSDPHQRHSFSIGRPLHPAASSFRGLSTWTASSRRHASRRGPHRKTFRGAAVRCAVYRGRQCADEAAVRHEMRK